MMTGELPKYGNGFRGRIVRPDGETEAGRVTFWARIRRLGRKVRRTLLGAKEPKMFRGRFKYDRETDSIVPCEMPKRVEVHYVIQDTLKAPIESMAVRHGGVVFESRSAYRDHLKERGYEQLTKEEQRQEWARAAQLTNEKTAFKWQEHKEDWERAGNDVKYGMVDIDEKERERCRREEREYQAYKTRQKTNWAKTVH